MKKDLIPMLPPTKVLMRVGVLAEKLDYNHKMMNIPAMWKHSRGGGVKMAILDTGLPVHVDLQPSGAASFIGGYLEDAQGHSTHCGGIIAAIADNHMGVAGIAPNVQDYYGAVLNAQGSGSIEAIEQGIYWAVDELGVDIISMSLGIAAGFPRFVSLEQACDYAADNGVTVFAAAGNESGDVGQPACYDSVIAVAACDSNGDHAAFSNTGPEVDFATGGVNVYSTFLNNTYARLSGTSMACPALAAVGALILSEHRMRGVALSPVELKQAIKKIAYDVGPDGLDDIWGHGIPIFRKGDNPYDVDQTPSDPPAPETPERDDDVKKADIRADCATWRLLRRYISELDGRLKHYPFEDALRHTVGQLAVELDRLDAQLRKA